MDNSSIRVGTASWSEPEFVKAEWYPKGLPAAQQLPFYAERFDMVELNSSFYAVTQARMCDRWAKATPDGFRTAESANARVQIGLSVAKLRFVRKAAGQR